MPINFTSWPIGDTRGCCVIASPCTAPASTSVTQKPCMPRPPGKQTAERVRAAASGACQVVSDFRARSVGPRGSGDSSEAMTPSRLHQKGG